MRHPTAPLSLIECLPITIALFTMKSKFAGCGLLLSLLVALGMVSLCTACGVGDAVLLQPGPERSGRLELALSASHDGVIYRLEASFEVTGPTPLTLQSAASDDTLSASLAPGAYRVAIAPDFRLLKETVEGLSAVQAELVSPAEQAVEVAPRATSRIAYRFSVEGAIIDLEPGTLEIGIEIGRDEGASCDGARTFSPVAFAVPGTSPNDVHVADIDGDSRLDLVFAGTGLSGLGVSFNRGGASFTTPTTLSIDATVALDPGDLDGDGDVDLVFAPLLRDAAVLLNEGDGTFRQATELAACDDAFAVLAVDLDGDGSKDLARACSASGLIAVALNAGDGSFIELGVFQSNSSLTFSTPLGLAAGDIDGDGDTDVAVVNRDGDDVSVLANAGDGTLSLALAFSARSPTSVVLDDLDGDGALDLAWTNGATSTVEVRLGGSAQFEQGTLLPVGLDPFAIESGDLDGDGDLDLAVANGGSDDVSLLLNAGDARFEPALQLAVSPFPRGVDIADVDADGDLDLVTADIDGGQLSLLINQRCAPR